MDWNLIYWFWFALCANHNILKRSINNNNDDDDDNKKLFSKIDNIQKQTGLDERYNNELFRIANNQNDNFNYTMNKNIVMKNLLYTLEDDNINKNHKLEIIEKYKDVIYNKTEGINLINGSLFDDWDFDFTL